MAPFFSRNPFDPPVRSFWGRHLASLSPASRLELCRRRRRDIHISSRLPFFFLFRSPLSHSTEPVQSAHQCKMIVFYPDDRQLRQLLLSSNADNMQPVIPNNTQLRHNSIASIEWTTMGRRRTRHPFCKYGEGIPWCTRRNRLSMDLFHHPISSRPFGPAARLAPLYPPTCVRGNDFERSLMMTMLARNQRIVSSSENLQRCQVQSAVFLSPLRNLDHLRRSRQLSEAKNPFQGHSLDKE